MVTLAHRYDCRAGSYRGAEGEDGTWLDLATPASWLGARGGGGGGAQCKNTILYSDRWKSIGPPTTPPSSLWGNVAYVAPILRCAKLSSMVVKVDSRPHKANCAPCPCHDHGETRSLDAPPRTLERYCRSCWHKLNASLCQSKSLPQKHCDPSSLMSRSERLRDEKRFGVKPGTLPLLVSLQYYDGESAATTTTLRWIRHPY